MRTFQKTVLAMAAPGLLAGLSMAQGSDACGTAQALGAVTGAIAFDTTAATTDGIGDPLCLSFSQDNIDNDVWFTWSPPTDGDFSFATCTTAFDTKIALYNLTFSTCPTGAPLACNDDSCGLQSRMNVGGLLAAASYVIRVGSFPGAAGGVGQLDISSLIAPANNDCANATAISGLGAFPFDNNSATSSGVTDAQCLDFGITDVRSDVWYSWTAPSTGSFDVSTCNGTTLDTRIAAYTACPMGAIDTAIACNDDDVTCGLQSTMTFSATSGSTYLLRIGSYSATMQGSGTFDITGTPSVGFPSFCAGDGTLATACPCGNFGSAGEGCANSTGAGGLLNGTGSGSLANADATLVLTQVPASQFGIMFSGLNNPEFAFGDGVRCVGMGLLRSAIQNSGAAATITITDALGAGGLSAGASDAGMTRHCQGWFRDPGGPCGSAFSVSNAVSISVTL